VLRTGRAYITVPDVARAADHGLPAPARGVRNTGEQAMLVLPEQAGGAYIGFVGPA